MGTLLIPQLLNSDYTVTVFDQMFYGCELRPQPRLKLLEADIRDTAAFREACMDVDAIIHLACISNDAGFELDEKFRGRVDNVPRSKYDFTTIRP